MSFRSDNTTGSAWVSSTRGISLPHRSESLESPFLAGDYAKADKRRQKREKRRAREQKKRGTYTRAAQQAPRTPARASRAHPVRVPDQASPDQAPSVPTGTRTVGRLVGITTSPDTSFMARAERALKNFSDDRLTAAWTNSIPNSSGFLLDGVELTKEEYEAWMDGDPEANRNVVVNSASGPGHEPGQSSQQSQPVPAKPVPTQRARPVPTSKATAKKDTESGGMLTAIMIGIGFVIIASVGGFGAIADAILELLP